MAAEYFDHIAAPGDRWDLLAWTYYGDATMIRPILLANPDLVGDPTRPTPLILPAGTVVRVPVLDDSAIAQAQLPPWKQGLV